MAKWSRVAGEIPSGEMSTLLSKDAELTGTMRTQGSMRIDGRVIGDLHSQKSVTIGTTGMVEGDVHAENVIVAGRVKGAVVAKGRVHLEASAEVDGDLSATRLSIQEGAKFRGRSVMDEGRVPSARPNLPKSDNDLKGESAHVRPAAVE